ncbi:MAG: hypothetical protein WCE52_14025 [Candidatus Acidiferrum sp.]
MKLARKLAWTVRTSRWLLAGTFALILLSPMSVAQTQAGPQSNEQLRVNWLYGAYMPKDVPLQSLSNHQRFQLFLRQSFTTPGVYVKTALFSLADQASDTPPEWGDGFGGYAKRTASRYGQFVTQNALAGVGNTLLGYEPRYNRCRCTGFWPRTRHAVIRNFVTYDRTEQHFRPQLGMYAGAFGAGVIAGTWAPDSPDLLARAYQGVITQVFFGVGANWLGEFAPDFKRVLQRHKSRNPKG